MHFLSGRECVHQVRMRVSALDWVVRCLTGCCVAVRAMWEVRAPPDCKGIELRAEVSTEYMDEIKSRTGTAPCHLHESNELINAVE